MASSSRSHGCGSRTEAPSADNALIAPQLNPEFDASEHRLVEAKAQIHQSTKTEMGLQDEIHALELKAANIEVHAWHDSTISKRKLTQQVGVIKEEYGEEVDREVVKDVLGGRFIAGLEVPKEEAQGEDVEASHPRGLQGEQPARATKKARKQEPEGPTFYKMVSDAIKEREKLQQKLNEEAIAKEAAAAAYKGWYCTCWSSKEEDSNDGLNDS